MSGPSGFALSASAKPGGGGPGGGSRRYSLAAAAAACLATAALPTFLSSSHGRPLASFLLAPSDGSQRITRLQSAWLGGQHLAMEGEGGRSTQLRTESGLFRILAGFPIRVTGEASDGSWRASGAATGRARLLERAFVTDSPSSFALGFASEGKAQEALGLLSPLLGQLFDVRFPKPSRPADDSAVGPVLATLTLHKGAVLCPAVNARTSFRALLTPSAGSPALRPGWLASEILAQLRAVGVSLDGAVGGGGGVVAADLGPVSLSVCGRVATCDMADVLLGGRGRGIHLVTWGSSSFTPAAGGGEVSLAIPASTLRRIEAISRLPILNPAPAPFPSNPANSTPALGSAAVNARQLEVGLVCPAKRRPGAGSQGSSSPFSDYTIDWASLLAQVTALAAAAAAPALRGGAGAGGPEGLFASLLSSIARDLAGKEGEILRPLPPLAAPLPWAAEAGAGASPE